MLSTKYESEKFTLWRLKMKVILVQRSCLEALNRVEAMDVALTDIEKRKLVCSFDVIEFVTRWRFVRYWIKFSYV